MPSREQLAQLGQVLKQLDDEDLYAVEAFAAFLVSRHEGPTARAERAGWPGARRREMTERRATQDDDDEGLPPL
jgi:hypothetical protein